MARLSPSILFAMCVLGSAYADDDPLKHLHREMQTVRDLSSMNVPAMSQNVQGNWTLLRIQPDASSGSETLLGGYIDGATAKIVMPPGSRWVTVIKGEWDLISTLGRAQPAKQKDAYEWNFDTVFTPRPEGTPSREYDALIEGGVVLVEHFPEKKEAAQFGKMLLVPAEWDKHIPAALEAYAKNQEPEDQRVRREQFRQMLNDKNPMTAVLAIKRLSDEKMLSGDILTKALTSPSDLRRAVAVQLAVGEQRDEAVPQEIETALNSADAATIRLLALGAYSAAGLYDRPEDARVKCAVEILRLCANKAKRLNVDEKLRKELNELFAGVEE